MKLINATLNVYSSMICMILVSYLFRTIARKHPLRKYFLWMCLFNLGMAVGDTTNWLCSGLERPWYLPVQWMGMLLYWISTSMLLLSFTKYLLEYLSSRVPVKEIFWKAACLLCTLHIAGTVLSIWNGMFFTITKENLYQRGDWFWLSQLIPFLMYAVDGSCFLYYRRQLSKREFCIFSSYVAVPLLAEIIQIFCPNLALLNAGVVFSLVVIFLNIQTDRERQMEKELSNAGINIMLSQIQPHFLYNVLTAIRQLCDVDVIQAKRAIGDFSQFLRGNMSSLTSTVPIGFEQELRHTESYLNLELQRFQRRLKIRYEIEARDFSLPPLTLQPIVENAVRHGVLRREQGGTVTIRTVEGMNEYVVMVEDDGVGFPEGENLTDGGDHIGIRNVKTRLKEMCNGTMEIHSTPNTGSTVLITIPKERGIL